MAYLQAVATIVRKDLLIEARGKDIILSVSFFVLLMVFIFNFAFKPGIIPGTIIAPGVIWLTILFSGMLSFQRVVNSELENSCMDGLILCPHGKDVIFMAKLTSSFLFLLTVEIIALPVFVVIFNLSTVPLPLLTIMPLATLGIAVVGTLLSVLSINTRFQEVMLPILLIPLVVPVVIGAVESTNKVLNSNSWANIHPWVWILILFDVIFLVIGILIFEYVLGE